MGAQRRHHTDVVPASRMVAAMSASPSPPYRFIASSARRPAIPGATQRAAKALRSRCSTARSGPLRRQRRSRLPWKFEPVQRTRRQDRRDGARFFKATNTSDSRSPGRPCSTWRRRWPAATSPRSNASASSSRRSGRHERRDAGDLLRRSQDRRRRGHQDVAEITLSYTFYRGEHGIGRARRRRARYELADEIVPALSAVTAPGRTSSLERQEHQRGLREIRNGRRRTPSSTTTIS